MPKLPGTPQIQNSSEHAQLLALINNMADGFIALNQLCQITLSNGEALSLLDTNVLNGVQLTTVMEVVDVNGYPIDIQKMIINTTAGFTNRDWRLRYKDNTTVSVQLNVSPVHVGFGQSASGGFVMLIRDITREKNLEEERNEFISVASHELRTPVAVAEGSLSNVRLMIERDKVPEPVKHMLDAAYEQVTFLSTLINDLSMLSRADNGKLSQSLETFAAGELVQSLIRDYQPQAAKKNLTLQPQIHEGLGLMTSSQLYVREVLQNFITNAIKYTEKGGIVVAARPSEAGVLFSVIDTGYGIGKNEQAKLFGKFFRSEDWRIRQVSGTGLGLYVSAKLAKLLNGRIEMQSELNKGSTFSLYVPSMNAPPQL